MTVKSLLTYCLLVFFAALPVHADSLGQQPATEAALDALFSMSEVQPEGSERVEPPKGFGGTEAGEGEGNLIKFLALQKRLGADLNTYRHLGTPLHHAIRGGLQDTARWLLKNGANPQLRVQEDAAQARFAGPDALGVAVSVSAWALFDEMRRLPVYKALPADEQARAMWPYAMDSADKTAMLLSKRVALPGFFKNSTLAGVLLLHSLCTGQPGLAQALLEQPDAPAQPAAVRQPGTPCTVVADPAKPVVAALSPTQWKAIEDRLQWPVLPFLVAQTHTPAQAAQWLAAGLRKPWGEPIAATQYVWSALRAPQPAALALLRAIPETTLRAALRAPGVFTAWLKAAADWPLADLRWSLMQFDAPQLAANLAPVMHDWSYAKSTGRETKDTKDRIERWALLTDRLAAPLPTLPSDGFLYWVPIELWPRWFALGFRVDDTHWASWLTWSAPAAFELAWPVIAQYQPAIAQRTLEWLVAQLSVGPVEDPQTQRLSYGGATYFNDADFLRKAKFLLAQRAHAPQPRWLAGAYIGPKMEPGVVFALAQNWVRMPTAALRAQIERAPLNCQPELSVYMRRSVASASPLHSENEGSYEGDIVQPISRLGEAACAWLVSGNTSGGRRFINEESFSQGVQRLTPCTEGSSAAVLWSEAARAWKPVVDMPQGGLVPIRVKAGGEAVFASTEVDYGGCGGQAGGVYRPRFSADGGLQLQVLAPGDPQFDALALQCDFRGIAACLGITDASVHPADALPLPAFVDKTWAKEKDAFLIAIDQLDRVALSQARADGMFANWLDDALRRVSASPSLILAEKRHRIAWVFAQRAPRAAFAPETLDVLVPWLPAEDWGPVLSALRCTNRYALDRLAEQAQANNLTTLHRRIQAAMKAPCE